jgi:hypothetical protein
MTSQDLEYSGMTKACLADRLKQQLVSTESEEEGAYDNRKYYNQAHNQDTIRGPDIKSTICETGGCSAYATIEVNIQVSDSGKINLLLENCKPKFSDSKSWVSKI